MIRTLLRRYIATLATLGVLGVVAGHTARAQSGARRALVVRVVDAAPGAQLLSDADITLTTAAGAVIGSATTTASGVAIVRFRSSDTTIRATVRRIGYTRITRSITIGASDSVEVQFALERAVQVLDTVRTGTRILSNNYTLGAAEIARSHDGIEDAYDALIRLRPNMLGDKMRDCPYVQNLWINGRLLPYFSNEIVPFDETGQSSRNDGSGRRPLRAAFPLWHAPAGLPLAMIRPDYIAEMRYVNCAARPTAGTRSVNALFISLKAGVGFDVKHGAYIADSASARSAGVIP